MMTNHSAIRNILRTDPIWSAYALMDLQPDFAPHCRWFTARASGGEGLALLYTGLEPPVLLTVGDAGAVDEALAQIDLPPRVYLSIREEHEPAVARRYDPSRDRRPMLRLSLPREATLDPPQGASLVQLGRGDAERLCTLFAHGGDFAPDAFDPPQLDSGIFWGVTEEGTANGALLAAGGTHIVDWQRGIAAVGNMYTLPDQRDRGHASSVLRALVASLRGRGVTNIVLNVDQRNADARRLYERHGFTVHCPFIEGIAELCSKIKD